MRISPRLFSELRSVIDSYRAGSTRLEYLASRTEELVTHLEPVLPAEAFCAAMNAVYVIEEINAVALDEGRAIGERERQLIEEALATIEQLFGPQ